MKKEGKLMKIAIIGTHGTGKTTLAKEFIKIHPEYFLISEVARVFGIEKVKTEFKTYSIQKSMQASQINIENIHENFISDRSVLDFGIYSKNENFIIKTLNMMIERYDYIFYIPIRFGITDVGFRNTDANYQKEIDDLFIKYIPEYVIKIKTLSIIDRLNEIEEHINGKIKTYHYLAGGFDESVFIVDRFKISGKIKEIIH